MTDETTSPTLPCPEPGCEGGEIWWQDTSLNSGRGRATPRESYETCARCDGAGRVDSWTCSAGCDRDFTLDADWPALVDEKDGEPRYSCRECVRAEALDQVDFAAVAKTLRGVLTTLASAVPTSIDTPSYIGLASGTIRTLAEQLDRLAQACGEKAR